MLSPATKPTIHNAASFNSYRGSEILLRRGAKCAVVGLVPLFIAILDQDDFGVPKVEAQAVDDGADVTAEVLRTGALDKWDYNIRNVFMQHMARPGYMNFNVREDRRKIIDDEECYKELYQTCKQ